MNRTLIALSLALACAGCTAGIDPEAADDAAADVDDPAGKEDGVVRPVGTFMLSEPGMGIQELTLFSDKTYHLHFLNRLRCQPNARCLAAIPIDTQSTGTYRFTKSGRNRYIRMVSDAVGGPISRYRYTYNARTEHLTLREVVDGNAYDAVEYDRDAHGGWCNTDDHCALQDLPGIRCAGGHWECSESFECVPAECSAN